MKYRGNILVTIIMCAVLLSNCRNKDDEHRIPSVPVDIVIQTNLAQYSDIGFVTGWMYVQGGSRGIIIYRYSEMEFRAFDRHVPYNAADNCVAEVLNDNILVEDPCSGSQWLIVDGTLSKGPATRNLVQYQTEFDGQTLYIFN